MNATIDRLHTPSLFHDENHAQRVADANRAAGPDWSYQVMPAGERFVIAVFDEDGEPVGTL